MIAPLLVARAARDLCLLPAYANRHGLVTGATGTGKSVTLLRIAERACLASTLRAHVVPPGVPVFMADVKGDLAGAARPGAPQGKVAERVAQLEIADQVGREIVRGVPGSILGSKRRR